jgi:hypothetical protein
MCETTLRLSWCGSLFIYLFIYSTTLSASQATQDRVIGRLVGNSLEMVREEAILFPICL